MSSSVPFDFICSDPPPADMNRKCSIAHLHPWNPTVLFLIDLRNNGRSGVSKAQADSVQFSSFFFFFILPHASGRRPRLLNSTFTARSYIFIYSYVHHIKLWLGLAHGLGWVTGNAWYFCDCTILYEGNTRTRQAGPWWMCECSRMAVAVVVVASRRQRSITVWWISFGIPLCVSCLFRDRRHKKKVELLAGPRRGSGRQRMNWAKGLAKIQNKKKEIYIGRKNENKVYGDHHPCGRGRQNDKAQGEG